MGDDEGAYVTHLISTNIVSYSFRLLLRQVSLPCLALRAPAQSHVEHRLDLYFDRQLGARVAQGQAHRRFKRDRERQGCPSRWRPRCTEEAQTTPVLVAQAQAQASHRACLRG
jgi:hypothetical protein